MVELREAPWQATLRGLEQRTAEMWSGHRTSLLTLGALAFAGTLVLGVLTAVLLSRTLARPLTEMSRAAEQIAAGRLDHPLTVDSKDEVGDLARALNRMAADLRTHEEALGAERADLAAKNAELERFTYSVSHDLKSPLVTIQGFAGLARSDLDAGKPERVRDDLARIAAAGERMHRLLEDLLALSRTGQVVGPREDVDLDGLAREAVEMMKTRLEEKGVAVEIADGLPTVRADRQRLLDVLQNLLDNAAKFGERGRTRVEVGARRTGDGAHLLFVRDNGPGIDPRFHEKVFGLFEKLDGRAEGTGVGLALVRRIVEAHGGRTWVESDGAGHGSTFFFTLPSA